MGWAERDRDTPLRGPDCGKTVGALLRVTGRQEPGSCGGPRPLIPEPLGSKARLCVTRNRGTEKRRESEEGREEVEKRPPFTDRITDLEKTLSARHQGQQPGHTHVDPSEYLTSSALQDSGP